MNGTTLWSEQHLNRTTLWTESYKRNVMNGTLSTKQRFERNVMNGTTTFWHYSMSSYVEYGSLEHPKYGWFGREKMPLRVILYYECSPTHHHHLHLLPFTYFIHKWSAGYMAQFLKPSQSFKKVLFERKAFCERCFCTVLSTTGCIILHIIF